MLNKIPFKFRSYIVSREWMLETVRIDLYTDRINALSERYIFNATNNSHVNERAKLFFR